MENKHKKLKKAMWMTTLALTSGALSMQASAEDKKQTEEEYRIEHDIDEDIELIDVSNKQLIKVETNRETKYYLCNEEVDYNYDDKYSMEEIVNLFKIPEADFLSSKRTKLIDVSIPSTKNYIDVLNEDNRFTIYSKDVDIFEGIYSEGKWVNKKEATLICWGDIDTYSSTITDEVYTRYSVFDVASQQFTTNYYSLEPEMKISVYYGEEIDEIRDKGYMTKEEIQMKINNLNSKNKVYVKR